MSTATEPLTPTTPEPVELRSEDVAAITADVWSCFLGAEVYALPEDAPDLDTASVLGSVGITGSWGGHVLLELPMAGAEEAAKRMLGMDTVTSLEVADALGELSNMVGGNIKSLLPPPCHLGLPMVVQGTVSHTAGTDTTEICRAVLGWADSSVRVSVWAKNVRDKNR